MALFSLYYCSRWPRHAASAAARNRSPDFREPMKFHTKMNTHSNLSSRISRALGATAILCCAVLCAVPSMAEDAYIESDGSQFINTGY